MRRHGGGVRQRRHRRRPHAPPRLRHKVRLVQPPAYLAPARLLLRRQNAHFMAAVAAEPASQMARSKALWLCALRASVLLPVPVFVVFMSVCGPDTACTPMAEMVSVFACPDRFILVFNTRQLKLHKTAIDKGFPHFCTVAATSPRGRSRTCVDAHSACLLFGVRQLVAGQAVQDGTTGPLPNTRSTNSTLR